MLIDGKRFFDMTIKNGEEACKQVTEMGRNNDYTASNLSTIMSTFENITN